MDEWSHVADEVAMKFGVVLVSKVSNPERASVADRVLRSYARTNIAELERPTMRLVVGHSDFSYAQYVAELQANWDVVLEEDNNIHGGISSIVARAGDRIVENHPEVTHIVFGYDDLVVNVEWLQQLSGLVQRHPDAKAWSVYRSAYERHHKIVARDDISGDVLMSMHDGLGCMTIEEWKEYGASKQNGEFPCSDGNTIDIHHAEFRPGPRWATSRDYWQNLGVHKGLEGQDQAIDFVGE
jgi:hypothetical protein